MLRLRWQGILVISCLLLAPVSHLSAPLAVYKTLADTWSDVALKAAEATIEAIQEQTGLPYSLREVPLETFGVYVGRQHQLAIELDGRQYELVLHDDRYTRQDGPVLPYRGLPAAASQAPPSADTTTTTTSTASSSSSSSSSFQQAAAAIEAQQPPFDPFSWQRQHLSLPEVTLAGPVELMLQQPTPLTLFLPHVTEVDATQRLLVGPGVVLTLQQLRGISLRKPVDLPHLPPSYVAQAFAQYQLGEAEPGFDHAPGMLYLANELYRSATNASLGLSGPTQFLLSFEIEPSGQGVKVMSAVPPHSKQPQQLRAKRLSRGMLEITLRHPEDQTAALAAAAVSAAPGGVSPGALAPHPWAWPLPATSMEEWVPYESLLRGLISSHPIHKGLQQGLALRLKRSSIKGISLIKFDMQLRGLAAPQLDAVERLVPAKGVSAGDQGSLEVWEVLVQVRERTGSTKGGTLQAVEYIPVSTKRKHAYHSTLSLSPQGMELMAGLGNVSRPWGGPY